MVLQVIFLCLLPHPHLFTPIGKQASATPAIHCAFGIRNWASPWKEKERGPPTWWMVVQGKKALSNSTAAADRCSITFFLFNQNFFLMLPIIFTLQAKLLKFSLHSYIIAVRRVYLVGINWTHPNYALIHAKQDRREREKFSFFLFTGTWWWKSALHWSRSLHLYREDYGAQHWPQGKFEIQMMQFRNSHQMHWNLLRENRSQNFLITSRERQKFQFPFGVVQQVKAAGALFDLCMK